MTQPATAFHGAPPAARRSIRERGLIAADGGRHGLRAVYLAETPELVLELACTVPLTHTLTMATPTEPLDVWRVDVDGLKLERDPNAWPRTGVWRYRGNIDRHRLALWEPWQPPASALPEHPLLAVLEAEAPAMLSPVHGWDHARAVATTGLWLAQRIPGADAAVAIAFGLLHDAQRLSDRDELGHGARAARYAAELHRRGLLPLERHQLHALMHACALHERGRTSGNATVGACWDADRLHLARVGVRPDRALLSTGRARELVAGATVTLPDPSPWPRLLAALVSASGQNCPAPAVDATLPWA